MVNQHRTAPELQIVMPIHNEGESIGATLHEWYNELSPRVRLEFVACEDGSTDNTKAVLTQLSHDLPIKLLMAEGRKGYSRAVIDGFAATLAPYVLAVDSDDQCDPKDFWQFWERRDQGDVAIGWRVHRADPVVRKVMSGAFKLWYKTLFHVPIHDPSCPYLLIRQHAPQLGVLTQGFWWEFMARTCRAKFKVVELPVQHRLRKAGATRVYRWHKVPGIAMAHSLGLVKIWRETR